MDGQGTGGQGLVCLMMVMMVMMMVVMVMMMRVMMMVQPSDMRAKENIEEVRGQGLAFPFV